MKIRLIIVFLLITNIKNFAQSVEMYVGDKRFGVDIMWFKNFKNNQKENTPFLYFSRNRANTDYHNAPTAFGSTNAVSYNFNNGIGVVAVASFVNSGFTPKAGIQYAKSKGDFMFFGWLVTDLKKDGNTDLFGLFRYQPKINENWKLFSQVELFPVYHFKNEYWNITERARLGVQKNKTAFGAMFDFNQSGKDHFNTTENTGVFVRHDF
jgi:hypothetical protein